MTVHVSPPKIHELPDAVAAWRADYPKFGALIDEAAPPFKALRLLGLALWADQRLDEAVNVLTASAALAPHEPRILGELGSLLCMVDRKVEALRYLTRSLEMDPNQIHVWLNVAAICDGNGDKETAEHAFRVALELDPQSAEASAGLGLLYIGCRRLEDAAQLLAAAVARGIDALPVYACLGQTLFQLGDFSAASAALGKAALACPDEALIVQKYAMSRLIETVIEASVEDAARAYRDAAGRHAEGLTTTCRAAFQTLCGYGRKDPAIRLGEYILARSPNDPIVEYYLDALNGRAHERAPDAYLTTFFDRHAPQFDRHLVDVLNYRIPAMLQPLLQDTGLEFARVLDLGCGTGLAAQALASIGGHLTGVDISSGMLEKARERGAYDALIEDEALLYLTQEEACFDLIVALDVLIYFGELAAMFDALARRVQAGGVVAFTYETGDGSDHALQPSGRFAHDPRYVERLYQTDFECLKVVSTTLRHEANVPVAGQLVLLRRRTSAWT
jgi:predicted TPR repeat methyltransferase